MNKTLLFTRVVFVSLCTLLSVLYTSTGWNQNPLEMGIKLALGLAAGLLIVFSEIYLIKKITLRSFNIALLGLFFGYLMGEGLFEVIESVFKGTPAFSTDPLFRGAIYLPFLYIGMILTARAADQLHVSIPFVRFKAETLRKKDILIDWSILADSRIIDISSSGLLDNQLVVPSFMLSELYAMLESSDETVRIKARRCLDVFKKIESMPLLNLRYSTVEVGDIKDSALKLVELARMLDSNIITADVARLQQYAVEGIRIINIHMLSSVLKPMATGEQICVKIQRYGKEPRQGVGYLDDGTMVVINGGAEYLGETIKAQVLSVKHTSSGRMIFCNAAEEGMIDEDFQASSIDLNQQKNYFL